VSNNAISIIIPVLNEAGNIDTLVGRIVSSMRDSGVRYEIIFVDDHSTDMTEELIGRKIAEGYPVRFEKKQGKGGKAFSIIEGVDHARFDVVCMIDADLQYAPEEILPMLRQMTALNNDVVISNRVAHETSFLRQLTSSTFHFVFTKLLFGLEYDTQSGLKVFKKDVLKSVDITPSPWSFDLQFIVAALLRGYSISSHDIYFAERTNGKAKVNVIKTSYELARESVKLRLQISGSKLRKQYKLNKLIRTQA
jgi:glycosyltransferase involved in cell wall biosynthesis